MDYDPLSNPRFKNADGTVIIVGDHPISQTLRRIENSDRPQLVINRSLGYELDNVDWLRSVGPKIVDLELVGSIANDSGIQFCTNLRELNLNTDCRGDIDWSYFSKLERAFTYASRLRAQNLVNEHLSDLHLYGASDRHISLVHQLPSLTSLTLSSTSATSPHWGIMRNSLRVLNVRLGRKLINFREIGELAALEHLTLDTCRHLESLDFAGSLDRLRLLDVSDCGKIETLSPLAELTALEQLFFIGSTSIVDGNLAVLGTLPKLREARFQNRRHYRGCPEPFPTDD